MERTVRKGQGVWIVLRVVMVAFLMVNLWYRFSTIFDYSRFVGGVFVFLGICSLVVIFSPKVLRAFLFFFGACFFLFGFRGYDIQSQVFETVVVFVALTVFFVNLRREIRRLRRLDGLGEKGKGQGATNDTNGHELGEKGEDDKKDGWMNGGMDEKKGEGQVATNVANVHELKGKGESDKDGVNGAGGVNRQLVGLILCYIGLSVLSLQLLPVGHIVKDFWLFGFKAAFFQVANTTPNTCLYPLAGINRLILYFVFAVEVSRGKEARDLFKWVFVGIFVGAVFCAFVGLLDYYGVISLAWYRLGTVTTPGVLHSTFLNRGWFAEFVLTVVPFVLIGFMSKIKGVWWKILLLGSLVICEIALILAGARAGWVSYPLILFICWSFFYFSKEGRLESFHFRWQDIMKVVVSVPITILISFLLIFQVFMPLSDKLQEKVNVKGSSTRSAATAKIIKASASRLVEPGGRVPAWMQGVDVGRERPLFGMGYESFCWHAHILSSIPGSHYTVNKDNKFKRVLDTPHNSFFQMFVSGGVVGVMLWVLIMGYGLMILMVDLVRNKRLLNVPVIISIISFHIYGIFQSMQYIPMIWMLIFLSLGYAMTIDEKVLPDRVRRITGVLVKVMIFLVLVGGVVYFAGRGSQSLAEKYGLEVYAKGQDWHEYHGFYHREKWGEKFYRWSGRSARVAIADCGTRNAELGKRKVQLATNVTNGHELGEKGKGGGSGVVEFDLQCHTPGVEKEPVQVIVSLDGERIDEIWFEKKGGVKRWYYVKGNKKGQMSEDRKRQWSVVSGQWSESGGRDSDGANEHEFLFEVSRTWNPRKMGVNEDRRDLGVAVSEPRLIEKMPKDGVGFYGWEIWGGEEIPGWPEGKEQRFRWTGKRASQAIADWGMRIADFKKQNAEGATNSTNVHELGEKRKDEKRDGRELTVFLRCKHPDVGDEAVVVRISDERGLLRTVIFEKREWRKVVLGGDELEDSEVVTFEVSRTWNPKRMGESGDNRDLGIAVAADERR